MALATLLNPLNTSMIAVALVDVQRSFGVASGASTLLLSAFAFTSAVAQPAMGWLADRFGPRRLLLAGLVVIGSSAAAMAWTTSFPLLVVLRALQGIGTATGYPAGIALLRREHTASHGNLPPAWLGVISAAGNASAALGPALGGVLIDAWGWRAVFFVSVPVSVATTILVLRFLRSPARAAPHWPAPSLRAVMNRSVLGVYGQMIGFSLVFYSVFFALPTWLEHGGRTSTAAGLIMTPLAAFSALATPPAVHAAKRWGNVVVLLIGAVSLAIPTVCLLGVADDSRTPVLLALAALFGIPNAFTNLGLQSELTGLVPPGVLGTAGGLFQTARFVGSGVAALLIGVVFANGVSTSAMHRLAAILTGVAAVLLVVAVLRVVNRHRNPMPGQQRKEP